METITITIENATEGNVVITVSDGHGGMMYAAKNTVADAMRALWIAANTVAQVHANIHPPRD